MYDYTAFNLMMVYMCMAIYLVLSTYYVAITYALVKIGELKPPYKTWKYLVSHTELLLGLNIKTQMNGFGALFGIFSSKQDNKISKILASSFRIGIFGFLISLAVTIVGLILANGQIFAITITSLAALTLVLWAHVRLWLTYRQLQHSSVKR